MAPEGRADLESKVGNEYAGFRVYVVEGVAQWALFRLPNP
jgi:hypothetical protein